MTQVNQHTDPVHLLNRLHAETRQPTIGRFKGAGRKGITLVVGELNNADSEPVEHATSAARAGLVERNRLS